MSSGCPQGARTPFLKVHEDSAQCISMHSPATSRIQTTSAAWLGIAHTNKGTFEFVVVKDPLESLLVGVSARAIYLPSIDSETRRNGLERVGTGCECNPW